MRFGDLGFGEMRFGKLGFCDLGFSKMGQNPINNPSIMLSWKQESAFGYFSETKTSFGFHPIVVSLNQIRPKFHNLCIVDLKL